jgi:hypothetical protein
MRRGRLRRLLYGFCMGETLAKFAAWFAIGLSTLSLAVSVGAILISDEKSNQATGNGVRQTCIVWAQFVIGEQSRHVPDARIDQEGLRFSRFTLSTVHKEASEPAHDTIPNVCGTAAQLRSIRGR